MDFSVNPTILKFFIFNPIPFFKVTKFLVKISQFKLLVMTEKHFWFINFFYHYIFQISVYFLLNNFNPLKKVFPTFSTTPFWSPIRSHLCNGACILWFCSFFLFLLAFTINIFSSTVGFQIIFSCYLMTFSCLQKLLLSSYCYFTKKRFKFWFSRR